MLEEADSIAEKVEIFNRDDHNPYKDVKKIILSKKIKLIVTVARGTSDCAALYASYLFAKFLGLPTYSLPPSQITLEKTKFDFSSALVLIISQSGLSEDLIECERACRTMGALTAILTNNNKSPMIETVNFYFNMHVYQIIIYSFAGTPLWFYVFNYCSIDGCFCQRYFRNVSDGNIDRHHKYGSSI